MKLRVRWTRLGKVRFVSHRDTARIVERALRRGGVAVRHSAGFTPRPRISFGLALPTGAESVAEYLDVDVEPDWAARFGPVGSEGGRIAEPGVTAELAPVLSAALPVGIDVTALTRIETITGAPREVSLQETVTASTWELWGDGLTPERVAAALELLDRPEVLLERERKGRRAVDDVRPAILSLHPDHTATRLVAELATSGRALRPGELAAVAFPDLDPLDVRVLRTHQWIDHDGVRREVLPLPADVDALAGTARA
jgi:hypothetical protein